MDITRIGTSDALSVWRDNINAGLDYAEGSAENNAVKCTVPLPDADPSVTHPSVVYVPDGVSGYEYWIAYTPWPDLSRENPTIAASNDGVNWVEPTGLVNPIATLADATGAGFGSWSDTHLIHDGTKFICYYRGSGGASDEAVYAKTSTDGVTWVSQGIVISDPTPSTLLSPSVVYTGSQYYMFVVNASAGLVYRYESADGLSFATQTQAIIFSPSFWHIDVQYLDGMYYMLMDENDTYDLTFFESEDGVNWSQGNNSAVRQIGDGFDSLGYYRSCFLVVSGSVPSFKVWVAGMDGGATSDTCVHTIQYRGIVTPTFGFISSNNAISNGTGDWRTLHNFRLSAYPTKKRGRIRIRCGIEKQFNLSAFSLRISIGGVSVYEISLQNQTTAMIDRTIHIDNHLEALTLTDTTESFFVENVDANYVHFTPVAVDTSVPSNLLVEVNSGSWCRLMFLDIEVD